MKDDLDMPRDDEALIRLPVLCRHLGISPSTAWSWVAAGRLPKPSKLSPRISVWRAGVIRKKARELAAEGTQ